jgi:hypothetical protein
MALAVAESADTTPELSPMPVAAMRLICAMAFGGPARAVAAAMTPARDTEDRRIVTGYA